MWWNQGNDTISYEPPDEWIVFFGNDVQQPEHPHEMSAEFLAGPLKRIPDSDELEEELTDKASRAIRILDDAWRYDQIFPLV
jgi:hypothetical protein